METGDGVVRLLDLVGGSEFARLENPHHEKANSIFFSQDGAFLVTPGGEFDPIHVWDLRKIRHNLAAMGLDWELPSYLPESPAWSSGPVQLQIDLGAFASRAPLNDLKRIPSAPHRERVDHRPVLIISSPKHFPQISRIGGATRLEREHR